MRKKKLKRRTSNGKWICCADHPMKEGEDPKEWIHEFKTVSEATMWTKLECTGCGLVQLASPKR